MFAGKQDPFEKMKWAEGVKGAGQLGAVDANRIADEETITL